MVVSNALVAMISIGDYSEGNKIPTADKDFNGIFPDLAVEKDTETLKEFCEYMNWTFMSNGEKDGKFKTHWTENEVMSFLQEDVGDKMFNENSKFDGLIVCVSCHGIRDKIVTSDIKTIDKTAIHRVLSLKYPKKRRIPRIFIFDCCDGMDMRRPTIEASTIEMNQEPIEEMEMTLVTTVPKAPENATEVEDSSESTEEVELVPSESRKNTDLDDVMRLNAWTSSTENPDYNMVAVYAANSGFVALMNYKGSYLVYSLVKAIKKNIQMKLGKTLAEVCEEVQNVLQDLGRQQTVNIFNNHTRTLIFRRNTQKK